MKSWTVRALAVLLALVMVATAVVVVGAGSARAATVLTKGPTIVVNGPTAPSVPAADPALARFLQGGVTNPAYWDKMTSSVQAAARSASGSMEVAIYTDEVADLGALLRKAGVDTRIGSVPSTDTGPRVVTVEVPAKILEKIAALDHVVAVAPAVTPQVPDQADPDLPARADGGAPAPTIIEAGKGHQVPEAWALGFTGTGINVAVMDSGVDFGHPDLQGTFARDPNTGSPYYDWPIAFDPNSMFRYLVAGMTFPAAPGSWYVDTSFTSTADGSGNLALFNNHIYNVAGIPSQSGVYHLGLHPDNTLYYYWFGERPAVLVTDSVTPGVYDTVYVDLNDDYLFGDDLAVDVASPVSWADLDANGIADVSGGMVYFISDGTYPVPYSNVVGNRYGLPVPIPAPGDLVAFMLGDYLAPGGDHGTLCSSAIVAQNVTGHVLGFAPGAKLIAVGDIYAGGFGYDIYQFVGEGYDGISGTGDEAQVASASFGYSGTFNDGWDAEARFVELMSYINMGTAFTVSTGNGGHGFGTVTSPASSNGVIAVGASTSYNKELGVEGFEDANHSTFGDVQPWSNRGPSTLGNTKPDVVTVGAWATGDGSLNSFFFSPPWTVWGGTSLSSPATAGVVALIAEAWTSNAGPWMNFVGKLFLDSGATNIHYDPQVMGHGLTNAYRSVLAASLGGGLVAFDANSSFVPSADWTAGDYWGIKYPSFARIMSPGQTNTTTIGVLNANMANPDDITVEDWELQLTDTQTFVFNASLAEQSPPDFLRPDYLMDLTPYIPAETNLVKVTVTFPYSEFDANGDYVRDSTWRLVLYDWDDYNGNGIFWNDANSNGVVNDGEMDSSAGTEIMRFTYGYPTGTNLEAFVHDPLTRIHNGLLLGIQARATSPLVPTTTLTVTVDYYEMVDAPWLSTSLVTTVIPAMNQIPVYATVTLPANQPFGTLSGMITITNSSDVQTVIPVLVNVAATGTDFAFGGDPTSTAFLDNNRVFGGIDWSWRAEAGDWRFFFTDIPDSTPVNPGDTLLVHTTWENVPTDIDTLVMGPTPDYQFSGPGSPWGPYTLDTVGASAYTLISAGTWAFQTATGGPEEWVAAPLQTGLHEIALHNVNYAGLGPSEVFSGEVGRFSLTPNPWTVSTPNLTGSGTFVTNSSLTLPGLDVLAFGVAEPVELDSQTIDQGGSWVNFFSAANIGVIDIQIGESFPQGMDIDLYLYWWTGTTYRLVASSAGPTASERVRLTMPADGEYAVLVDGYSVPAGTGYFDYFQAVVAGTNLTPMNVPTTPIPAGTPSGFDIAWSFDPSIEPWRLYLGVLFVGPTGAPALEVDAAFYTYDGYAPEVLATDPANGTSINTKSPTVTVDYQDPQITSGIQGVRFIIDGLDVTFGSPFTQTQFVWSFPFDLTEGSHDARFGLYDGAGYVTWYSWTFTIDTTAPTLSVTSPTATLTNISEITVAGTTDLDASLTVNGVPVSVDPGTGDFTTTVTLTEGSNTITVVAMDPAGNTATDVRTVVLDTIPPELAVATPSDGDLLNTGVVHVAGTSENGAVLTVNGVMVAVDSSGNWAVDLAFADGAHAIMTTAVDAAGNSAQDVRTVTIDTMAPALSVTSPSFDLTNVADVSVEGMTEADATLTVNGAAVTVAADGSFSTTVTLASGSNTIEVEATDPAGNTAMVTKTVVLDTTAPAVAITAPAASALLNQAVVHVTGTAEDGAQVTVNGVLVVVTGGAWSVDLAFSDGAHAITVVATDAAGNTATVSRSVTIDTVAPALSVDAMPTLTNAAALTVSGTTEAGATLTVNGVAVTVGSGGAFSTSITLVSGANTITIVAHDAAGNAATVVRSVTLDATPPVVTVSAPVNGLATNHSSVVVTGTVDDATAMVLVNGIVVQPSSSGAWSVSVALAEGSNTITVSAVDPAGNQATAVTRQVTYTSPIPDLKNGIANNQNAIDSNTNQINTLSGNLMLGLIVVLVVALAAIGAVYVLLSRKIKGGSGAKSAGGEEGKGEF